MCIRRGCAVKPRGRKKLCYKHRTTKNKKGRGKSNKQLGELPGEIFYGNMMFYMSVPDIRNLCTTSKGFNMLCNDDIFWKMYYKTHYGDVNSKLPKRYKSWKPYVNNAYKNHMFVKMNGLVKLLQSSYTTAKELDTYLTNNKDTPFSGKLDYSSIYLNAIVMILRDYPEEVPPELVTILCKHGLTDIRRLRDQSMRDLSKIAKKIINRMIANFNTCKHKH